MTESETQFAYISFYAACCLTGIVLADKHLRLSAPLAWLVGVALFGVRSLVV